jgi:hypothetical protein
VAYVDGATPVELDRESSDSAWCPIREAGERLPLPDQRRVLDRVIESLIRKPPDEALRIV